MRDMLTAEQVHKAIEKRFDFDVWVPPARWQAIADELNSELGSGDNIIKAMRVIGRNGITEYRVDVRSVLAIPDYEQNIPDKFIAASLANQLREFVNSSVLDERIETEYRTIINGCTCPCCGRKLEDK